MIPQSTNFINHADVPSRFYPFFSFNLVHVERLIAVAEIIIIHVARALVHASGSIEAGLSSSALGALRNTA